MGKESTYKARDAGRYEFDPQVGKNPWRRAWQFTPVFLPGESLGQSSLVAYSPWGCKKSDMTEATKHTYTNNHPEKNTFRMHDREDWKWATQVKTKIPLYPITAQTLPFLHKMMGQYYFPE